MRPSIVAAIVVAFLFAWHPATSTHAGSHPPGAAVALAATGSTDIPMFAAASAAQKHCPSDVVVWLNTNSGIYHMKGERWYGRTKHGAYVCKKDDDDAGYRETENGQ